MEVSVHEDIDAVFSACASGVECRSVKYVELKVDRRRASNLSPKMTI